MTKYVCPKCGSQMDFTVTGGSEWVNEVIIGCPGGCGTVLEKKPPLTLVKDDGAKEEQ